jgi:preprotein translocase SecE subunit
MSRLLNFRSKKVAIKDKKIIKLSKPAIVKVARLGKKPLSVLAKIGGYFKGSWIELRQVRWPDRKATWSLTLAVILFSGFFVILILLLDEAFNLLFKFILK